MGKEEIEKLANDYVSKWDNTQSEKESFKRHFIAGIIESEPKRMEEMELFAMNYCIWYCYSEDAQIYKSQNLTSYQMLQLYKDRPFLRTDMPQSN